MSEHTKEEVKEKNLELDRLVFFSDAVVAIAITLLALDLSVPVEEGKHLSFADIGHTWHKFASFALSFLYISVFWTIHHRFFYHIKRIDNKVLWYNLGWLLFIVLLPFSTTLISANFFDRAAIVVYCFNTLMVTVFQNQIWDYISERPDYLKSSANRTVILKYRVSCNVAMINALVALGISFFSSIAAFVVLISRFAMISLVRSFYDKKEKARKLNAD